jgi:aminoglycoside phosphotransferase (APT) family kinase protein
MLPPLPEELARRATAAVATRVAGGAVAQVEPLLGGSSSLTYQGRLVGPSGEQRVVIKVAPPGLPPVRNRDVLRQARVLDVLAAHPAVRVPEVFGTDAGAPPEVPPLFVMSYVEGESFEPCLASAEPTATRAQLEARALEAARMLAALHAVPPSDSRVAAEPVQDLPAELARWQRAFASTDPDLRGGEAEVHAALERRLPAPAALKILHGDYRLGNMQCRGSEIGALIDWEIWSVGDPRLDLAWFLLNSDRRHPSCVRPNPEMPPVAELRAAYEQAAGRRVDELAWFAALVRYKQAAASALIAKNTRKLARPGVDATRMAELIPKLLRWALESLGA